MNDQQNLMEVFAKENREARRLFFKTHCKECYQLSDAINKRGLCLRCESDRLDAIRMEKFNR